MKNIALFITASLISVLGCQSSHYAHNNTRWLTPSKRSEPPFLGQTPSNDLLPFPIIFPEQGTSQPSFDPFAPIQQSAINLTSAAEEAERNHLKTLAMTVPAADAPSYLQPLKVWNGPFATRIRQKNLEQEIIRQVSGSEYEQVAEKFHTENLFDWEKEDERKRFDWSVLDPTKLYSKTRNWMGMGPDEDKANESLQKGREILLDNPDLSNKRKNLDAAKHFNEAAKRYPNSLIEEDSLYLAGECYYFAEDYPSAYKEYHELIMKYRYSKHVDTAERRLFKIGRYWELESERSFSYFNFSNKSLPNYDTFGFAKKAYETIFLNDPLGPVSDDALMALATAYFKRGRYQGDDNYNQAAFYYQQLREEYPLSPHFEKAYENELYARTQAYLGPEHPSRTLEEAQKIAEITMRQQFSNGSAFADKADILEITENILDKKAERLWTSGQFWDKKRYYGSAKLEYEQLITEYPQTEYAERARQRMAVIESLPGTPPIFGFPINPFKVEE